jgi:AsmA protein
MPGCGAGGIDAAWLGWNIDMRALKIAGAAIAAVIVIAALLLVIGIPSGFLTSAIQERVERETGYRLTIAGAAKIGVWPSLNVTLNDVTLQDPKDRDTSNRLTVGSVQADLTLGSVWSGHPQVTELVITKPVLYMPLLRDRSGAPNPASATRPATSSGGTDADANAVSIDHVRVTDGAVVLSNLRDRVEDRVDGINADVRMNADRKVAVSGTARANAHPLKFEIKATAPPLPIARQNIPLEWTLDASSLLQAPLSGKAEVRLNGSVIMINGLTGALGDGAFTGWASVDLSSKPLVKVDLDFQRLDIGTPKASAASSSQPQDSLGSQQGWSNASIDVNGLNYVDAQVRVSAAELNIGDAHVAPAAIDAALSGGVLKATFSNLGVYEGHASGMVTVDASTGNPAYALQTDLSGVHALPLLRSAADFDSLDGKLQAKIGVKSTGTSQRAIMSNLNGAVFAVFQDGAIRGLNVAQMVRSLTAQTLSGWQENQEQTTDLTQLSASFRLDKGQATTTDLNLVGPLVKMTGAGTIDLGTRMIAFRVEPKLVMTTQGQGRAADPVGLGIPVIIDGSWSQPRIYPEMAGILDNPDAAYAKLKDMGKGLFGANGGGLAGLNGLGGLGGLAGSGAGGNGPAGSGGLNGQLGATLGNLLQQGLGQQSQSRAIPPPTSSSSSSQAAPPLPAIDPPPLPAQDSQPMNDVLKQLFNR